MIRSTRFLRQTQVLCHWPRLVASNTTLARPQKKKTVSRDFDPTASLEDNLERIQKHDAFNQFLGPRTRANLVSEELCDDALKLLDPSLEAYRGCEILDLFPGVGLWSRKVNDLLKPTKHTLIDVKDDGFGPFLDHLTHDHSGNYELKSIDISQKAKDRRLVYEDISQYLRAVPTESQKPLLILANLTRTPFVTGSTKKEKETSEKKKKRKVSNDTAIAPTHSEAVRFFYDIIRQITQKNDVPVRPLRIILWLLERDKLNLMPRTVGSLRATAMQLEQIFSGQEVVGLSEVPASMLRDFRPARLKILNKMSVAQRMVNSNIDIPEARQDPLHARLIESLGSKLEPDCSDTASTDTLEQQLLKLEELEYRFALDKESMQAYADTKIQGKLKNTSELFAELELLRAKFDSLVNSNLTPYKSSVIGLHQSNLEELLLIDLERSIALKRPVSRFIQPSPSAEGGFIVYLPPDPRTDRDHVKLDLPTLTKMTQIYPESGASSKDDQACTALIDNYHALCREEPLLTYDLRAFEPLQPRLNEFYPQHSLALLDFTPRPLPEPIPGAPPDVPLPLLELARLLRRLHAAPLPFALDTIAHGCADALLPDCPSVSDPAKGGRLDVNKLRVRMLTQEMWREVITAWYKWPFRRSDEELKGD